MCLLVTNSIIHGTFKLTILKVIERLVYRKIINYYDQYNWRIDYTFKFSLLDRFLFFLIVSLSASILVDIVYHNLCQFSYFFATGACSVSSFLSLYFFSDFSRIISVLLSVDRIDFHFFYYNLS